MMKKKASIFAVILLSAGTLVGCGKDNADSKAGAEPTGVVGEKMQPSPTIMPTAVPGSEPIAEEPEEKLEILEWFADEVPSYPGEDYIRSFSYQVPEAEKLVNVTLLPTEVEDVMLARTGYMPDCHMEESIEYTPEDYDALTLAEDAVFFMLEVNEAEEGYRYGRVSKETFLEKGTGEWIMVCGVSGKEILYVFQYMGS
ncbi:MAG: hypothetical protein IJY09_07330 [Lachnospiraceae bacterium]|nr:hypothetical protein [Lachnospiraceae bacterium]